MFFRFFIKLFNHFIDKLGRYIRHIRRQKEHAVAKIGNGFQPQINAGFDTGAISRIIDDIDIDILQRFFKPRRRWEGEPEATLRLRDGGDRLDEASVNQCRQLVDEYLAHDRIHWGEDADVEEDAYQMCIKWQSMGKSTLLIAGTNAQVRDINKRFILERRAQGKSESDPDKLFQLRDGVRMSMVQDPSMTSWAWRMPETRSSAETT